MKNYSTLLQAISDGVHPEDPQKYENITENEAMRTFASKKVLFKKVGDAQAQRIGQRAEKKPYVKLEDSKLSSIARHIDVNEDGDVLRTWPGLYEELHRKFPKTLTVFSGTFILTVGITLARIIIAIGQKGLQLLYEQ